MASSLRNLSEHDPARVPSGADIKIGICVSEWNEEVTAALLEGCLTTLKRHGVKAENIGIKAVPGSFELPYGARVVAEEYSPAAVICLGCVIRGDTPHFDYICQGVTKGITELNLDYDIPFVFGILTTENLQQALDRCGGKHGNKGDEAAVTALKMARLREN
ncbi:MAG: 6,7-dimethyl-8-ribityllumazine synthase [Bacteroidetes bacterium]|nr:MAG: 6,7-dimethyl-8-ribityllumazine synthase [Bacteroidota bacterium]